MFTCPRCNKPLSRNQSKGGVYWFCPQCEGRTATVAMLRRSADPNLVAQLWEEAKSPLAVDSLPCPACRGGMKAVWLPPSNGNFQIDVCMRCHLTWFDAGEYMRVPTPNGDPAWSDKNIPLAARLAMVKMHVEALDPRPDMRLDSTPPPQDWKAIPALFGMPVKQDSRDADFQPWGTWCLTAAIVVVGILGLYSSPRIFEDFGFIPAQASRSGWLTIFTSILLHGSLPHLATSAYFLLTFGDDVEALLGTSRFLLLLASAFLCGNILHYLIHTESTVPVLGAGAGVSGLLAAYGIQFPHARIGFIFRLPVFIYRWINLPAWLYILFWIVLQAIGATVLVENIQQVSWAAHLGGAAAGGIAGLLLANLREISPATSNQS